MSRYFDDELTHSGVKGMKWRKHKYKSAVKDANGNLKYFYNHDLFNNAPVTGVGGKFDGSKQYFLGPNPNHTTRFSKGRTFIEKDSPVVKKRLENDRRSDALNEKKNASANRLSKTEPKQDSHSRQERRVNEARAKRAEKKDKDIGKRSREYIRERRSNTGTSPLTRKEIAWAKDSNGKLNLKSTVRTGRSGEQKQRDEKRAAEQKKREIKAQRVANNYKAKATGKRASWAEDKPYQSKAEYDQENQRYWLKERDKLRKKGESSLLSPLHGNESASKYHDEVYKDRQRNAKRSMEGFETGLSERHNSPSLAGPGHRARAAESTARHKAAVKAQKKKKNKNKVTDTIDKGRKAVEEFFTPKKKKKR